MTNPSGDVSEPNDAAALEAEIAALEERLAANRASVSRLMREENLREGVVHASSIHEAKQTGMILRCQKEMLQARLKRRRCEAGVP